MAQSRRVIERWFIDQGVPQLIEGYRSEQRMDARATPFIAGWLILGTLLVWGPPVGVIDPQRIGLAALVLAITVGVLAAYLWARGRPPFRRGVRLDPLDIGMIGLVPGIIAGVLDGSLRSVFGVGGFVLLGVGVIYIVIGFALFEVGWWALRHLRMQLAHIATLVAGTLPLLLILVVFLLFASELWQAAHTLAGADLAAVIGLLFAVAALLVVTRAREEVRGIEHRLDDDMEAVAARLAGTPAAGIRPPVEAPRPLRWLERLNVVVLMLVSQLVQSLFVAAFVVVILIALGILAVPASVQETWVGEPVRTVLGFSLLGEPRLLSVELLVVAGLLGGMCGLYFTGLALTDAAYRAEFHANVVADVEQILAVRAAYLAMPMPAASGLTTIGQAEVSPRGG